MTNQSPKRNDNSFFSLFIKPIINWFGMVFGICIVAGLIGTGAGLFAGFGFGPALFCGLVAIIVVLVLYMLIASESSLF